MTTDNNLLILLLIGIVLFWIYNMNVSEKFNNGSINNINNTRNHVTESYRADSVEVNEDKSRASSPLQKDVPINDAAMIDKLYSQRNSKSPSGQSKPRPNQNPKQKLIQTPPSSQNPQSLTKSYNEMAKQYVPDAKQKMYNKENPLSDAKSNKYYNFNDDSYMLIPKDSLPDAKFKKVMPPETRKTLASSDLLPVEANKDWFQVPNPTFNLLQAVDLEIPEIKIGIDTVGQSRKNATYDLRAAPPNPKFVVSPWSNSTIEPDYNTKPLC
jgi:hypothetical protein